MMYSGEEILDDKEKLIYRYICAYIFDKHFSPSITDISEAVGLSIATVPVYLHKLVAKGLITVEQSVSRSIALNRYEYNFVEKVS